MHNWLKQNPKNVCVITCSDGRGPSGVLVCAMFCFCHLFTNPVPAMQLLSAKRPGPGLWPSHKRYVGYVCSMVSEKPTLPHSKPLVIKAVTINPIPCFNKQRSGCRPFCDVLIGETKIFSTAQEYERMREYRVHEGKVLFNLGVSVQGDVVISAYHMRSHALQAKVTNTQIFQIQFHTGFISPGTTVLKFMKMHCFHYLIPLAKQGNYAIVANAASMDYDPLVVKLNKRHQRHRGGGDGSRATAAQIPVHLRGESGIKKMCRNIFVLQQNLTNITMSREADLDFASQTGVGDLSVQNTRLQRLKEIICEQAAIKQATKDKKITTV
ncbi:Cyclin-G-associated kinase [Bagarius yarrelli]|uniref:Cyclin-G-associated kinase n=1 Tax=Bagarius yarrelli TaxID=175774 RepID=A0A556V3F0_BAGYA|nr:Cyclin-G-associated kinase [Bagarius yarrelli]